MARKPPPVTSASNYDFPVWMIVITLCLSNRSNKKVYTYHKKGRWRINIVLAYIYHPVDHDDKKRFNEELASFYNAIPRIAEILSG